MKDDFRPETNCSLVQMLLNVHKHEDNPQTKMTFIQNPKQFWTQKHFSSETQNDCQTKINVDTTTTLKKEDDSKSWIP